MTAATTATALVVATPCSVPGYDHIATVTMSGSARASITGSAMHGGGTSIRTRVATHTGSSTTSTTRGCVSWQIIMSLRLQWKTA